MVRDGGRQVGGGGGGGCGKTLQRGKGDSVDRLGGWERGKVL